MIASLLTRARTPFVNVAQNACAASQRGCEGYICHVDDGLPDVGRVFADLITYHKWTAVQIVYDHSVGMSVYVAYRFHISRA